MTSSDDDDAYLLWAENTLGVRMRFKIGLREFPHPYGRGLVSLERIPSNQPILSLPFSALMTKHSLSETAGLEALLRTIEKQQNVTLREDDILALMLIFHKHILKNDSKWFPHIKRLPLRLNNFFFWEDEDIEMLSGTYSQVLAVKMKEQVHDDFIYLMQLICSGADYSTYLPLDIFTFEEYRWAIATIWSRFVSIKLLQGGAVYVKAMIPVFDMINHAKTCGSARHSFDPKKMIFSFSSGSAIQPNQQILFNYGIDLPNAKLLQMYGFVDDDNHADFVEIVFSMSQKAVDYDRKRQILEAHGYGDNPVIKLTSSSGLPAHLMGILRVQHAATEELDIAAKKAFQKSVSVENETVARSMLKEALEQMLSRLIMQESMDDENDQSGVWSERKVRRQGASIVKDGERRILSSLLMAVQQAMDTSRKKEIK